MRRKLLVWVLSIGFFLASLLYGVSLLLWYDRHNDAQLSKSGIFAFWINSHLAGIEDFEKPIFPRNTPCSLTSIGTMAANPDVIGCYIVGGWVHDEMCPYWWMGNVCIPIRIVPQFWMHVEHRRKILLTISKLCVSQSNYPHYDKFCRNQKLKNSVYLYRDSLVTGRTELVGAFHELISK